VPVEPPTENGAAWTAVTETHYRLDDRYALDQGRVFLSGVQALARLPLEQMRAGRRLRGTPFDVTGYESIKERAIAAYERRLAELLVQLDSST